jgi:hypothetical protein
LPELPGVPDPDEEVAVKGLPEELPPTEDVPDAVGVVAAPAT